MSDVVRIGVNSGKIQKEVNLGELRADTNQILACDTKGIFSRNCLIIGSPNSGKTWTTARLMQEVRNCGINSICFDTNQQFHWKANGVLHTKINNFFIPDLNSLDCLTNIRNLLNVDYHDILSKLLLQNDIDDNFDIIDAIYAVEPENSAALYDLVELFSSFLSLESSAEDFSIEQISILDGELKNLNSWQKGIFQILFINAIIEAQATVSTKNPLVLFFDTSYFLSNGFSYSYLKDLFIKANAHHVYICATLDSTTDISKSEFSLFGTYIVQSIRQYADCEKIHSFISRLTLNDLGLMSMMETGGAIFINYEMISAHAIQVFKPEPLLPKGPVSAW